MRRITTKACVHRKELYGFDSHVTEWNNMFRRMEPLMQVPKDISVLCSSSPIGLWMYQTGSQLPILVAITRYILFSIHVQCDFHFRTFAEISCSLTPQHLPPVEEGKTYNNHRHAVSALEFPISHPTDMIPNLPYDNPSASRDRCSLQRK